MKCLRLTGKEFFRESAAQMLAVARFGVSDGFSQSAESRPTVPNRKPRTASRNHVPVV